MRERYMLHRLLILAQIFMLVVQPRVCTCAAAENCVACHNTCESVCDCCCEDHDVARSEQQYAAPSHDHREHTSSCMAVAPRIELKQSETSTFASAVNARFDDICPFEVAHVFQSDTSHVEELLPRPAIPLYLSFCAILV